MKTNRFSLLWVPVVLLTACEQAGTDFEKAGETFYFACEEKCEPAPDASKTVYQDGTIFWSEGDMIRMAFKVGSAWATASGTTTSYSSAKIYASEALNAGGETAEFKVPTTFTGSQTGNYSFYTVYPSSVCGTSFVALGKVTANLPATQTPPVASFDPKADLMVGTSPVAYTSKPTGAVPLIWTRLVSHANITLKNIKGLTSGETVTSVTFTAQNGCILAGTHTLDITTGALTPTSGSSYNSVTVKGDNLSFDGGNLEFWACILPVTLTRLDVTLVTDKATYTRDIDLASTPKTFKANAHCTLGVNMANCTRTGEDEPEVFTKVTSEPDDWSGDYLIVYEDDSKALDGSLTTLDASGNTISVTISDGEIEATDYNKARLVTIAQSGSDYTIKTVSGYYIGNTSNSNGLPSSTSTAYTNTITLGSNGVNIKSSGGAYLRYNSQSDQERFRYYRSSSYTNQQPVALYKLSGSSGGSTEPDPETFTASVTTKPATSVSTSGATLNASYSGVNTTNLPQNVVFKYGTSQSNLNNTVGNLSISNASGTYSWTLDQLTPGQMYYFQASMDAWNPVTGQYQTITGAVLSFTTSSQPVSSSALDWAELPALDYTHYTSGGNYYIDNSTHGGKFAAGSLYYTHLWTNVPTYSDEMGQHYMRNYTSCWSSAHKCPVWVAAALHPCWVGSTKRTDAYKKNPYMPSDVQYVGTNASNDSYNRGHMLASNQRTLSKEVNYQVFYTTNIAPQANYMNGQGTGWNNLEDFVMGTKAVGGFNCSDTLYVVIGNYFEAYTDGYGRSASPTTQYYMSTQNVHIPTMMYVAVLRTKSGNTGKSVKDCRADELKCVAFRRTQNIYNNGQAVTASEMMSVADLEALTGFTFFANVPNAPKSTYSASDWGL